MAKRWVIMLLAAAYMVLNVAPAVAKVPDYLNVSDAWVECKTTSGIAARVVKCIESAVQNTAEAFFYYLFPYLETAIAAAMTLSVIIYGILFATQSVEKPSRDALVQLMKIGAVVWAVQMLPEFYHMILDMMEAMLSVVFTFGNGISGMVHCPTATSVWDRMDCMVEVIVGVDIQTDDMDATRNSLKSGILGFLFSMLGASFLGFIMGVMGLYIVLSVLFALVKGIFTYMFAIIALAFMVIIGPMVIPLLLFKATIRYFHRYIESIIAMVFQPILIMAFMTFMIIALDHTFYSGEYSFMRVLVGEKHIQDKTYHHEGQFSINKFLTLKNEDIKSTSACGFNDDGSQKLLLEKQGVCQNIDLIPTTDRATEGGKDLGVLGIGSVLDVTGITKQQLQGTSQQTCLNIDHVLNFDCLAQIRKSGGAPTIDWGEAIDDPTTMESTTFVSIAIVLLTMFLFISMMNHVPHLAGELAGGVYQTPQLYQHAVQGIPGLQQGGQLADRVSQSIGGRVQQGMASLLGRRG